MLSKTPNTPVALNQILEKDYVSEPLVRHITNKRNALERAMLHFANYKKNTTKLEENLYECCIYYNQDMETELLIEVLSFGPMIKVIGNERFLNLQKKRLEVPKNILELCRFVTVLPSDAYKQ